MQEASLRPMGIGSIIDRTFKLYRNNFTAIILFTLLIGGTANLIVSIASLGMGAFQTDSALGEVYSGLLSSESIGDVFYNLPRASQEGSPFLSTILSLAVIVFVTPLVTGGVVLITLSACHVGTNEGGRWFSQVKKIYLKLVGTQLAMFVVAIIFFIALAVPLIIILLAASFIGSFDYNFIYIITIIVTALIAVLASMFFIPYSLLIFPVAIHENRFGFKPVGRAWQLLRRRFWKSAGVILLTLIIVYALSSVATLAVAFFPTFISTLLNAAISALLAPISSIAATLLYLDIRMTVEGYDLELRAAAMKNAQMNMYIAETPESTESAENKND